VQLFTRTLIGLATGADSAIATAYIAGYAPKNRRGSLAMLQQWTMIVGILVAYIVALIIFGAFPGGAASTGWRLVLGLGAIPALMGLGLHTQMRNPPRDSPARPLRRDAQGHGHPRHEGCQRRRHAAARHVGNGAELTLTNSGIGQSVIALAQAGSASPRIDNHAGIVRPGGGGQASPEVDADLVVPVGENLGDRVTEAHRLTPPHTSGLGSWLSTSGCGSATRKADAALPRSGRGPIHVRGWRVDGADWRGARALATCTVH
jgi:Sugar (and other) transporter